MVFSRVNKSQWNCSEPKCSITKINPYQFKISFENEIFPTRYFKFYYECIEYVTACKKGRYKKGKRNNDE